MVPNAAKELAPSSSSVKSDLLSLDDDDASHPRIPESAVRNLYIYLEVMELQMKPALLLLRGVQ